LRQGITTDSSTASVTGSERELDERGSCEARSSEVTAIVVGAGASADPH
jgi:hypothetical protein